MKVLPLLLTCGLAVGLGMVQASPATDLYSAATRTIKDEYFGWSTQNFSVLAGDYAQKLQEACAGQGEECDYATGRQVLGQLLAQFGDQHTAVRDPDAAQRLREVLQDMAVARTGLRTVRAEGGLLVVSVMPGSPAEAQGLRRFDLLTTVAGQEAGQRGGQNAPIGPGDFMKLERLGQPLAVTVQRTGQPEWTLDLQTATLKARDVPTLTWLDDAHQTALIDLPTFLPADSSALFLKAVQQARQEHASRLLIDLRYNTGGSLNQCVAAASIFGPVLHDTRFKVGGYVYSGLDGQPGSYQRTLQAPATERVWNGPAAVLVGPNTASCAEVFSFYAARAGAVVVGEPTKGVGNSGVYFHDLPDGGLLAVTVLRAFDAAGKPLPAQIIPDVSAPTDVAALISSGQDSTLQAALGTLQALPLAVSPSK